MDDYLASKLNERAKVEAEQKQQRLSQDEIFKQTTQPFLLKVYNFFMDKDRGDTIVIELGHRSRSDDPHLLPKYFTMNFQAPATTRALTLDFSSKDNGRVEVEISGATNVEAKRGPFGRLVAGGDNADELERIWRRIIDVLISRDKSV